MQICKEIITVTRRISIVSTDAAAALLQSFRRLHDSPAPVPEVSAEAAAAVARRNQPRVQLPAPLAQELAAVLAEQRLTSREARRLVQQLTEKLKALSHTPQRGGVGPHWAARAAPVAAAEGGGGAAAAADGRRDRLRGPALAAAREAFETGELSYMDERAVNAVLGLPPPLRVDERHAPRLQKLVPQYRTEAEAVAYAVTRLLPEYAVCVRVLEEAARMAEAAAAAAAAGVAANRAAASGAGPPVAAAAAGRAAWRPREVLVHGAGVGAAVVAVLEALAPRYPLSSLVAVEPSPLRQLLGTRLERAYREGGRREEGRQREPQQQRQRQPQEHQQGQQLEWGQEQELGQELQQQQQQRQEERGMAAGMGLRRPPQRQRGAPADPRVSWVRALAPLSKAQGAQRRRYDLVVAPYQLTLLSTAEDRQRLVRQLWERCNGVLVLIEPGTPRGFENVAEARQLILGLEGRKRAQLELAATGSGRCGPGGAADPRVLDKLRRAGAHVLAPCPHDGTCPMQATGRNWCHFGQSLRRPAFMQQLVAGAGGHAQGHHGAPNEQDERFSYVVLRRGPRPQFRVAVAREYGSGGGRRGAAADASGADVDDGFGGAAAAAPPPVRRLPERLPPRVVLNQVLLNRAASAAAAAAQPPPAEAITASASGNAAGPGVIGGPRCSIHGGGEEPTAAAVAAVAVAEPLTPRRPPLFSRTGPTPAESDPAAAASATAAAGGGGSGERGVGAAQGAGEGRDPVSTPAWVEGAAPVVAGPVIAAFASKYPAFGPGLVTRLMALQDAGVDWMASETDEPTATDPGDSVIERGGAAGVVGGGGGTAAGGGERPNPDKAAGRPPLFHDSAPGSRPGAGSGSGSGPGRSPPLHSLGLDTAVAELSLSLAAAGAGASAGAGEAPGMVVGGQHVGAEAAAEAADTAPPPSELPLQYDVSAGMLYGTAARQGPLCRDDVSEEEYARAERQLMERIFGVTLGSDGGGYGGGYGGAADSPTAAAAAGATIGYAGGEDDVVAEQQAGVRGGLFASGGESYGGSDFDDDDDEEEEAEEGEQATDIADALDVQAAEAASYTWGRLVRPPRRRGGHVLLDLCVGPQQHYPDTSATTTTAAPPPYDSNSPHLSAATDAAGGGGAWSNGRDNSGGTGAAGSTARDAREFDANPDAGYGTAPEGAGVRDRAAAAAAAPAPDADGDGDGDGGDEAAAMEAVRGRLVQQVVAKSARRSWMGSPAYRLARRLEWGDVWPDWYTRSHNSRESMAKPAKVPSGGGR